MALSTEKEIEELADNITLCADSIHNYLMNAISRREIDKNKAQLIFQDEVSLRQRANGLYIDAANCVVKRLAVSQEDLISVIATAKERIATIGEIQSFIDLTADLLMLAAACYAGNPAPILAALKEVRKDVVALG
jgi:hypothetical protein